MDSNSVSRLSEFRVQEGAAVMETIVVLCFAPPEQLDKEESSQELN